MQKKRLVFFHVPKCAGTSVEEALRRVYGRDQVLTEKTVLDYLEYTPASLRSYKILAGHITHDTALAYLDQDTHCITLFRNPLQRLRSLYNYFTTLPVQSSVPVIEATQRYNFRQWLSSKDPSIVVHVENAVVRQFSPESFWNHTRPANPELIIETATRFVSRFEVVGAIEEPLLFLQDLKQRCGISIEIPHANRTHRDGTLEVSDEEMSQWFQDRCGLDLQFYRELGLTGALGLTWA